MRQYNIIINKIRQGVCTETDVWRSFPSTPPGICRVFAVSSKTIIMHTIECLLVK